jgi:hypothetical protein
MEGPVNISDSKQWWWLSYADEEFKGAVIVNGDTFMIASLNASLQGINPGGECAGFEIPDEVLDKFPPEFRNRLLDKDTCLNSLGGRRLGDLEG